MYIRAIGDPSQGFFNAIAFVFMTPTVRSRLIMRLKGYSEEEMMSGASAVHPCQGLLFTTRHHWSLGGPP